MDIHVTIGRYEFALEHTVVEAAERVTENYESVFVPIQKHLKEAFPDGLPSQVGHYYLILPVQIAFRDGRKAKQRALEYILKWVRKNADALDDESQTNYDLGAGRGGLRLPVALVVLDDGAGKRPHCLGREDGSGDFRPPRCCANRPVPSPTTKAVTRIVRYLMGRPQR